MKGVFELPGDKSISHRILMLAALASGACKIRNLNSGDDCASTVQCLRQLGIGVEGEIVIHPAPFQIPDQPLDCGNSGSTIRMLTGLLAGQDIPATLIGDLSLIRRPMRRLAEPLRQMGAVLRLRDEEFPPIVLDEGIKRAIIYRMPINSAQVKTAILFAGMRFPGTRVSEPVPTRDHTERLFEHFKFQPGRTSIPSFEYDVPADPSSAAFFIVAALLRRNSDITFKNLLMNPYRVAYMRKLHQAGAPIEIKNRRLVQNELVADVRVRSGVLMSPIQILPEEVPSLIDEIPVLSLIGTVCGFDVSGAQELRLKECDRIEAMVSNLQTMNVRVEEKEDGYRVWPGNFRETVARTFGDHRIAMTFAAAGMELDDPDCVKISFPEFFSILEEAEL
ncbi:3-phosphoshikimate 1-carboxyvinyltransferase [bacterium]|nr:3-phosphoshikimate 1-carboxyvinyltransferase [bacterium]MCI0604636.1 3-phosphoshikimate 1-carboxyvinyltransferase [bacterium]